MRRRRHNAARGGFALIDVIVGAVILGIGLAVVISLSSRSLATQSEGERQLVAAWLADELMNTVLVEGPEEFPRLHAMYGDYEPPFEDYAYEISIEQRAEGQAYRVTVHLRWDAVRGPGELSLRSFIAPRLGEDELDEWDLLREPIEFLDREQRHHWRIYGRDEFEETQFEGTESDR